MHRQQEHDYVDTHVGGSHPFIVGLNVDAMICIYHSRVESGAERMTLEDLQADGYEEPNYTQDTDNKRLPPEGGGVEDSAIQEQDRKFNHGYGEGIR